MFVDVPECSIFLGLYIDGRSFLETDDVQGQISMFPIVYISNASSWNNC